MNDAELGPYSRFFGALGTRLGDDRSRHLRFFGELGARMGDVRRAERGRHLEFFSELSPRLETARALERELDRQLARRFNVFHYLSTIEVGLSRIIADLLNPEARHGQGTLFLRTLLDELAEIRDPTGSGHRLHQEDQRGDGARHHEQPSIGHLRGDPRKRWHLLYRHRKQALCGRPARSDQGLPLLSPARVRRPVPIDLPIPHGPRAKRSESSARRTEEMGRPPRHHGIPGPDRRHRPGRVGH